MEQVNDRSFPAFNHMRSEPITAPIARRYRH